MVVPAVVAVAPLVEAAALAAAAVVSAVAAEVPALVAEASVAASPRPRIRAVAATITSAKNRVNQNHRPVLLTSRRKSTCPVSEGCFRIDREKLLALRTESRSSKWKCANRYRRDASGNNILCRLILTVVQLMPLSLFRRNSASSFLRHTCVPVRIKYGWQSHTFVGYAGFVLLNQVY